MIDKEDYRFLKDVRCAIEKAIANVATRYGNDLAYYNFRVICDVLNINLEKVDEFEVIRGAWGSYCNFCGAYTCYYDRNRDMHLCAMCLGYLERIGGK